MAVSFRKQLRQGRFRAIRVCASALVPAFGEGDVEVVGTKRLFEFKIASQIFLLSSYIVHFHYQFRTARMWGPKIYFTLGP